MTLASDARAIWRAAVASVAPGAAVAAALDRRRGVARALGRPIGVPAGRPVPIVALGKAAVPMALGARRALGGAVRGVLAVPESEDAPAVQGFRIVRGGHPLPDAASEAAAEAVMAFVEATAPDPVLFLVSGGGSASVESPAPGLSLPDLVATTRLLLASGAPIQAMNRIRRHLSSFKGGQLAARAGPGRAVTLAISDVVGDTPWDIASGPTVADPSTYADALASAAEFGILDRMPPAVRRRLEDGRAGRRPETPKPGDPRLSGQRFHFIASNETALTAAASAARDRGYRTLVLTGSLTGEAREIARVYAGLAREVLAHGRPVRAPACLLAGGETTVTLGGAPGRGGRSQELVLAAAVALDGLEGCLVLAAGTDGLDGPTDAAGGWADGRLAARARREGIDLRAALARHNSYPTLDRLGALWRTGPTGTNVMDVHVVLLGASAPARPGRGRAGSSPRRGARSSRGSSS